MKPANTKTQAARRKSAILSAVSATLVRLTSTIILLWLWTGTDRAGLLSKALLVFIVLELGSIPPVWISLKARLKEIEGGEEDAASQY